MPHMVGNLPRQLSTLAAEESFSKTRRDSVDLAHERLEGEGDDNPNPLLIATRDSMIISKQRFGKHPKLHGVAEPRGGYFRVGGLSPILDASPPDRLKLTTPVGRLKKQKTQQTIVHETSVQKHTAEVGGHPEKDDDCPIYEVERPRSHVSNEAERAKR